MSVPRSTAVIAMIKGKIIICQTILVLLVAIALSASAPVTFAQGDCTDYVDLSGGDLPIEVSGSTADASGDYTPFEPTSEEPDCWQGDWSWGCGFGPDTTYKWTAPFNGRFAFEITGSDFDTVLLIYTFTCPIEPIYPDDFVCGAHDGESHYANLSGLELAEGEGILIVVDGFGTASGDFDLSIYDADSVGSVLVDTFESPTLGRPRSMEVHLPPYYDPALEGGYPVVYFLHGMTGTYDMPLYAFMHDLLDDLINQSLIEPMILVKPDGSTAFLNDEGYYDFGGSNWFDSELYGQFEHYIVYDVPEYIEANYNVSLEPANRAIMGHSMGGFGAMNAAIRHHDRYRAVAAHSGYPDFGGLVDLIPTIVAQNGNPPCSYDPAAGYATQFYFMVGGALTPNLDNPPFYVDFPLDEMGQPIQTIFYDLWVPNDCSSSAVNVPLDTPLKIYFDCGTNDDFLFYSCNTAFATTLDDLGFVADLSWSPGDFIDGDYVFWSFNGGHLTNLTEQVERALRFIDEAFTEGHVAVEPIPAAPGLELDAHPNPFNPQTTITFALKRDEWAKVGVYELTGRRMVVIADRIFDAGANALTWSGCDSQGRALPSGTYIVRLETESGVEARKVSLIR
jgi:S-formylglutathione hydrolase FrmB